MSERSPEAKSLKPDVALERFEDALANHCFPIAPARENSDLVQSILENPFSSSEVIGRVVEALGEAEEVRSPEALLTHPYRFSWWHATGILSPLQANKNENVTLSIAEKLRGLDRGALSEEQLRAVNSIRKEGMLNELRAVKGKMGLGSSWEFKGQGVATFYNAIKAIVENGWQREFFRPTVKRVPDLLRVITEGKKKLGPGMNASFSGRMLFQYLAKNDCEFGLRLLSNPFWAGCRLQEPQMKGAAHDFFIAHSETAEPLVYAALDVLLEEFRPNVEDYEKKLLEMLTLNTSKGTLINSLAYGYLCANGTERCAKVLFQKLIVSQSNPDNILYMNIASELRGATPIETIAEFATFKNPVRRQTAIEILSAMCARHLDKDRDPDPEARKLFSSGDFMSFLNNCMDVASAEKDRSCETAVATLKGLVRSLGGS